MFWILTTILLSIFGVIFGSLSLTLVFGAPYYPSPPSIVERMIKNAIIKNQTKLKYGNFFKLDLSQYDVIFYYLFPPIMKKASPYPDGIEELPDILKNQGFEVYQETCCAPYTMD